MRIWFIRHGLAYNNVANVFSNRPEDTHELTPEGHQQVMKLALSLAEDLPYTALYSSDLKRAMQTAGLIGAAVGLPIQPVAWLREHHAGELEGRSDTAAWTQYTHLIRTWFIEHNPHARITGGESLTEMRQRFRAFVDMLMATYTDEPDARVLVVGHGGLYMACLPYVLSNVTMEFAHRHQVGNAGVITAMCNHDIWYAENWDGMLLDLPEGI